MDGQRMDGQMDGGMGINTSTDFLNRLGFTNSTWSALQT